MGEDVFRQQCARCHAIEGRPMTGHPEYPGSNFNDVKPSFDYVLRQMRAGLDETMPSFRKRLTPEQLRAVANYVTSVAAEDGRPFKEPR